jgi:hypothetical protein
MSLHFNNTVIYILAAIFGILAALVLFEAPRIFFGAPRIFGGMLESKGNFDIGLLSLGSVSTILGAFQFLFMRTLPRNSWLSFSVVGAILIYAEVFNVKPIKFTACAVLLHGKHHSPVYYSNGIPFTLEERCKGLAY